MSLLLVFMFHYLVGDPIRFVIFSIADAIWHPKPHKFATDSEVGHQTRLDYLKLRLKSLRAHLLIPEKHRDENLNSQYKEIEYDLWQYGKYLACLILLVLITADGNAYQTKKCLQHLFSHNYSTSYGLLDANEITSAYDFIATLPINDFHLDGDSNRPEWVHGNQTKLLGVVRLRQLRVTDVRHDRLADPPFSNELYMPGWKLPYQRLPYDNVYWRIYQPWIPKISNVKTPSYLRSDEGYFRSYPMLSGYVALLARSHQNSLMIVDYLRNNNWLNYNTSVLFIEYSLYSTDAKLLSVCTLRLEQTPFGTTIPYVDVDGIRALEIDDQLTDWQLFLIVVYAIVFLQFLKGLVKQLWFNPENIRSIWNIVDIGILVLNLAIIVLLWIRNRMITMILKHLSNKSKMEYIEVTPVNLLTNFTRETIGFLLCLTTLRLWKALTFSNVFHIFTHTLYLAWEAVATVGMFIIVLILGFGMAVSTINGNNSIQFSPLSHSIITCTCFTFGFTHGLEPEDLFHGGKIIGTFFFSILAFIISVILINMFASIINDYFYAAKSQRYTKSERRINIFEFMYAELSYYILWLNQLRFFRQYYHRKNRTVSENIELEIKALRKKRTTWLGSNTNTFIVHRKIYPIDINVELREFERKQERIYTIGAIMNTQIDILQTLSGYDEDITETKK